MITKLTEEEQKDLISDDAVKTAFLKRSDIVGLPVEEQEKRWSEHLVKLDEFRSFLSGCDAIVL